MQHRYDRVSRVGRRRVHDNALRIKLLDRAGEVLSAGGRDALNLRRLASDVGTSTTAVYSLFGSKADLIHALLVEGFRRLREHLESVAPQGDPVEHLVRLSHAYRASARSDPQYYRVMFEGPRQLDQVDEEIKELSATTFQPLLDGVQRCIDEAIFTDQDPSLVALSLWALVHGLVTLELSQFLPEETGYSEAAFDVAVRTGLAGWRHEPV
jgi:AcrR family transcriptional regulator